MGGHRISCNRLSVEFDAKRTRRDPAGRRGGVGGVSRHRRRCRAVGLNVLEHQASARRQNRPSGPRLRHHQVLHFCTAPALNSTLVFAPALAGSVILLLHGDAAASSRRSICRRYERASTPRDAQPSPEAAASSHSAPASPQHCFTYQLSSLALSACTDRPRLPPCRSGAGAALPCSRRSTVALCRRSEQLAAAALHRVTVVCKWVRQKPTGARALRAIARSFASHAAWASCARAWPLRRAGGASDGRAEPLPSEAAVRCRVRGRSVRGRPAGPTDLTATYLSARDVTSGLSATPRGRRGRSRWSGTACAR